MHGKLEKFLFVSALFMHFAYFGILNIALCLKLPNSIISGGIRVYICLSAISLIFISIRRHSYPNLSWHCYTMFFYIIWFFFIIFCDDWSKYPVWSQQPKWHYIYVAVFWALASFMLMFVDRLRFNYIIENPWVVYSASFLSVLLIVIINRGSFGTLSIMGNAMGINRANINGSLNVLYAVSMYYLVIDKAIWKKVILGIPGVCLAIANLIISDSRTSIIVFGLIFLFYIFLGVKRMSTIIVVIITSTVMFLVGFPIILQSNAFKRFSQILYIKDEYILAGNVEFSRIDLYKEGINDFLKSPLWGGHAYLLESYGYSHMMPIDVLRTTGIIGGLAMLFVIIGITKGYLKLMQYQKSYWLCAVLFTSILHEFTAGSASTMISYATAIMLIANSILPNYFQKTYMQRLYN